MTIARTTIVFAGTLLALSAIPVPAHAQTVDQLTPNRVKLESVEYKGKRAIKVTEDGQVGNGEAYAIVKGPEFRNGTIDVELAGLPLAAAGPAVFPNMMFLRDRIIEESFALLGPYSYLGGGLALDFGGRHGSATASGIIDGIPRRYAWQA